MPRPRGEASYAPANDTADVASRPFEFLAGAMNHGPQQASGISGVVEQFRRFQPPAFEGSPNSLVAVMVIVAGMVMEVVVHWKRVVEKVKKFLVC